MLEKQNINIVKMIDMVYMKRSVHQMVYGPSQYEIDNYFVITTLKEA